MKMRLLLSSVFLLVSVSESMSQTEPKRRVEIKKGLLVVLRDNSFVTKRDTVLLLSEEEIRKIKIKQNPYAKSSKFYDSLKKDASGNKVTREIFDLVVRKSGGKEKLVSVLVKSEDVFKPFTNFIIGSIVFQHVDLLEGSVIDTLRKASTRFGKFVNKVHVDTRKRIVEHNLLFEVGDKLDPYKLADNERVLRQFITLRDARIYVTVNKKNKKTVDVAIVTQDRTSLGVSGSYNSLQRFRFDVYDINILGYARQLQLSYFRSSADKPKNGYEVTLREPNIKGTFIQGEVQYTNNYLRERTRVAAGRDFFTPEIKYAGGMELYRTSEKFYFEDYDTLEIPYTENTIDLWAGRSFEFQKRINAIFSVRMQQRNFIERPFVSSDSNSFFYDRTLLLGNISVVKRNFLKSLRIRGFGKTEDVPVGRSVSVVFGKEINEFTDRMYTELGASYGRYFSNIGYVNLSVISGSFFKPGKPEDGLLTLNGTYFSDLFRVRRMQIRQFLYFTYIQGFNRVLDRTVTIEGKWRDERDVVPLGNERMTWGVETVYFMTWYAYGFQFALFHRLDINLLSNASPLFRKRSLFPTIRAGVRTLNENLVLPAISIDVAFYGKNKNYASAWEIKFATTLPNLFGTNQAFKPQVSRFQ